MNSCAFGIWFATAAVLMGAEPVRLIDIDPQVFPADVRTHITECLEDLSALQRGEEPLHATAGVAVKNADGAVRTGPNGSSLRVTVLMDGGTGLYQGRGYRITMRRSLTRIGGVSGFLAGPEVIFEPPLGRADDSEVAISFVRFVVDLASSKKRPNK